MVQQTWPVKSFLKALRTISPTFADTITVKQSEGNSYEFRQLLQIYRTWYRNTHISTLHGRGRGSVYATDTPTPTPTLHGKDKDGRPAGGFSTCLCGSPGHSWSKCPHIFEWNRPSGFKIDESIQRLIEEKKSKNSVIRSTLKKIRYNHNNPRSTSQDAGSSSSNASSNATPNPADSGPQVPMGAMAYRPHVTSAVHDPELHFALVNSYILDSGATEHVCNDRSRFTTYRLAAEDDILEDGAISQSPWTVK